MGARGSDRAADHGLVVALVMAVRWWFRPPSAGAAAASKGGGIGAAAGGPGYRVASAIPEALWTLRDARAGSRRWTHWLDRLSGQYVYRLPWYLVVGDTGSGKTALLHQLHGGAPSLEFAGAGGGEAHTAQLEWHLGDSAVLVDTPGRFIEAATAAGSDRAEFHQLLRHFRPRQPLNGVVLVIDVSRLPGMTSDERKAHGRRLRTHLLELQQGLDIRLPVYLVLSHVDRLSGFQAYFHELGPQGREQIWGFPGNASETPAKIGRAARRARV